MNPPKMTYYARVRSNLTDQILTNWKFFDASLWYYGKINSNHGGESEYIVEFDVWNNEPAFNVGDYSVHNKDATNCQLAIKPVSDDKSQGLDLALFKLDKPFMYGRCFTTFKREAWTPITISHPLTNLYSSVYPDRIGYLRGLRDHMIIQTKIILPENSSLLDGSRYPFTLAFEYDYD